MSRETETYRDYLELLYERFGRDTAQISLDQAARLLHRDRRTLLREKSFPVLSMETGGRGAGRRYRVPLLQLARWMSRERNGRRYA